MGYCVYMTRAGFALQAKLFAEGGELEITRVEVGSGILPEDADWRTLEDLLDSRATATSTAPVRRECTVSLEIEYRADLSEAEEPFQINEFGVFAIGAEGEEALILYGDLSDCPDTAVPLKYGGCVRRYPVLMEIGPDANAKLGYPAGAWATHEELTGAVAEHNSDPSAHADLLRQLLDGAFNQSGVATPVVTIPADAWQPDEDDGPGAYRAEVPCEDSTSAHIPYASLDKPSMGPAAECGFSEIADTADGVLRFWADRIPETDIIARVALFGPGGGGTGAAAMAPATATRAGVVKPGEGLTVASDGTLSIDFASEAEVNELLKGALAPDNK